MGTDQITAEWLAARLARKIDALIWPTLTYGYYPAFTAYAGSCSLSRPAFMATLREIIEGLLSFGARAVLVLDTGVSTIAPAAEAIAQLPAPQGVHHLKTHAGPRYRETAARLSGQMHGTHADELETSCMLVWAPELVDMRRAVASPLRPGAPYPGPLSPDDPGVSAYSPSGSYGDPTLATREKGEALIAAMVEDLIAAARAAVKK